MLQFAESGRRGARLWGRFPHCNILISCVALCPATLRRSRIFLLPFSFLAIHSLEVIRPLPSTARKSRIRPKICRNRPGVAYYTYRYYDPLTGRWPSRDPIGEEGGVNMYGFVGNDGVNAWDVLGLIGPYYSPNWGIPPSNSKPRPCSPGAGDQFNPFGLRGDTSKKNYKNWFETRFPKTVAGAKSDLETRIKEKVCATKGQSPSTIPDLTDGKDDIDVKNDMKRYGDPAQGPWERHVQIGNFEFKAKNVKITNWHKEPPPNCADCFDYEATVYIEEQTGADPPWAPGGEDCYEDPLWFTGMFGKRKVNMGEWNVKGAHCCP